MSLHAIQNDLNRREMEKKYRKKSVVEFFGDADLDDMSDRFEIMYKDYKKQLDELRGEIAGLKAELVSEEGRYDKVIESKSLELNNIIKEKQGQLKVAEDGLAEIERQVKKKECEITEYDEIRKAQTIALEKRESESKLRGKRLDDRSELIESRNIKNNSERRQINADRIVLQRDIENNSKEKEDFKTYHIDKVKELSDREDMLASDEETLACKLLKVKKAQEDIDANMADVKAILDREESVSEREEAVTEIESANSLKQDNLNNEIVKNKVNASSNSRKTEELDKREHSLNIRENNIKALEADLAK